MRKLTFFKILILVTIATVTLHACKQDEYYIDGGTVNPKFNGSMLQYLQSQPRLFDTLTAVIKIAGLEKEFSQDDLTFFAPVDNSFRTLIASVNSNLFQNGKDTIKTLSDIEAPIWKKYLTMYMYKGGKKVKDFTQVDPSAKAMFPGQNFKAYSDDILNIGVFYNDVSTDQGSSQTVIKYAGYRQLYLSYIPNPAQPFDNWVTARVSSSDIQLNNGVVHVLLASHSFGFDAANFIQDVRLSR